MTETSPHAHTDSAADTPDAQTSAQSLTANPAFSCPTETVRVERSVRISRLLLLGMLVGAAIAVGVTLIFPVVPEGHYTLGQIAGFMALIGAALGLLSAAVLALALGAVARRSKGTATAQRLNTQ